MNDQPTPADHIEAARRAVALISLAERNDTEAFSVALAEMVSGPESAGSVVYGLVEVARFALGAPALPRDVRLPVLEGMVADLAADVA